MSNIKIFICAHKDVPLPQHPYFLPIQAGAALRDHIDAFMVWKMVDPFGYSSIILVHRYSSAITNQFFRKSISHPWTGITHAEKRSSYGPQEYRLHSYWTHNIANE